MGDFGAVASEIGSAFEAQNCLGHDGARGIARAQEQNVVMSFHGRSPSRSRLVRNMPSLRRLLV